jgi:hypothetical protein
LAGMTDDGPPHTPLLPFKTLCTSLFSASFWPEYLAATSLKDGPMTLLLTEWQVKQFFDFAKSAFAIAEVDTKATALKQTIQTRFIRFSTIYTGTILALFVSSNDAFFLQRKIMEIG